MDGNVVLSKPTLPVIGVIYKTMECHRTVLMLCSLVLKFGDRFEIEGSQDSSRFCPFTGGGGIHILRKENTAASVAVIQQMIDI